MVGHYLRELKFFMMMFYNNGLAIWHVFQDITLIKVNNGHKSAILNLMSWKGSWCISHICLIFGLQYLMV